MLDYWPEKIEKLALKASEFLNVEVTKDLSLLTIRHYTKEKFDELTNEKTIILRQQTTDTIQVLLK